MGRKITDTGLEYGLTDSPCQAAKVSDDIVSLNAKESAISHCN